MYVDGPFKTLAMAAASSAGLNGIETTAAGGLFSITAVPTAHLTATVNAVASCLARTTSTKPPARGFILY